MDTVRQQLDKIVSLILSSPLTNNFQKILTKVLNKRLCCMIIYIVTHMKNKIMAGILIF